VANATYIGIDTSATRKPMREEAKQDFKDCRCRKIFEQPIHQPPLPPPHTRKEGSNMNRRQTKRTDRKSLGLLGGGHFVAFRRHYLPPISIVVVGMLLVLQFTTFQRYVDKIGIPAQSEIYFKAPQRIWIDVVSFSEGIAGWKTSLMELLHIAQSLNATLVEPCMGSGRLGSCAPTPVGVGDKLYTIPVSELFDLEQYKSPSFGREFPVLVSFDNYQAALGESDSDAGMVKLCASKENKLDRCSTNTTRIREIGQNDVMEKMGKSNADNFIIHIEDYWKGTTRRELGWRLGMGYLDQNEMKRKMLPFHPKHLQFVDDLLERGNLTSDNFSAIHWRAEKVGMNYTRCAMAVNDVKNIMLKRNMWSNNATESVESSTHKFVLLSSLNEDADKMWGGARRKADSDRKSMVEALRYLLHDNGFIKIDNLLGNEHKVCDSGMLAIYDLIIAAKANNFASCVNGGENGCTQASQSLCKECNHVGNFGRMATLARKEKGTMECWPTE